ncbi:MAG: DoxX family protein [Patescibacteria group bacterium]|nr:DoxX family protein [Patescibacteria group bacterium]
MKSIRHHFHSPALGLFIIRFVAGVIFLYEGIQKLNDMHGTIAFFASLGFGAFFAWLVAIIEILGGASLILGLWSKFFSFLLAITMIVAIIKVTGPVGIEMSFAPLLLLSVAIAVLFSGCGAYSICRFGHRNCNECADGTCGCAHGMKK